MLPEKYSELGFEITKFGSKSLALRHHDKAVYVFDSGAGIEEKLVSILCDCHLKLCREKVRV